MMDDLDSRGLLTDLFTTFWKPAFDKLRAINPQLVFIAEQFDWELRKSYGEDYLQRADTSAVFAFPIQQAIRKFDKAELVEAINDTARLTPAGKHQMVFAENHDVGRIASDPLITPEKLRTAAALTFFLKGTPILYYGQELGMRGAPDSGYTTDESAIGFREAFKWVAVDAAPGQAIWYRRPGERYWDQRYARDYDGISVEEETARPGSLLTRYRQLSALRRGHAALRTGSQKVQDSPPGLLVIERHGAGEALVVVSNLTKGTVTYIGPGAGQPDLIGGGAATTLAPWPTVLLRIHAGGG